MNRRDLEASWARTRSHLAAAVAILVAHETAPPDLCRYEDWMSHNELELALEELFELADDLSQPTDFWARLCDAAEEMGLMSIAARLRLCAAGAKFGWYEALLSLTPTASGGRSNPVATNFRCPWDIGSHHEGLPTLNDAALVLLEAPTLAPGQAAEVRLHPLAPELWGKHLVGRIVRPWDGRYIGEALVTRAVAPWHDRHTPV